MYFFPFLTGKTTSMFSNLSEILVYVYFAISIQSQGLQLGKPYCNYIQEYLMPLWRSGFPGGSEDKVSACNAGDPGLIPGLGISHGEGNGNPLQYSCLENPMDRGAWRATVQGVTKSQTRLSDFTIEIIGAWQAPVLEVAKSQTRLSN